MGAEAAVTWFSEIEEFDPSLEAEVTNVLAAYGDDARAAVRGLIVKIESLENQIEETVGGISAGYVRARLHARNRQRA